MAPSIERLLYHLTGGRPRGFMKLTTAETEETSTDEALVPWRGQYLPWNGRTCLAVVCYVIKFCSNSENCLLNDTIRRLDNLAGDYAYARYNLFEGNDNHFDYCNKLIEESQEEFSEMFVNTLIPMVHKFFSVPKLNQLCGKDKELELNEILAGFMDFLLQILNCEENIILEAEERYALLRKEFKFLITFLGDTPFQCTDELRKDQVNVILQEFEMLANKAGSFIYSCVFSIRPVNANWFYAGTNALLQKVELLNAKIKQHCVEFSELPMFVTLRSDVVDSFFTVNSLVENLENMMNGRFNFTDNVGIKSQIEALHDELTLLQKYLKVITVPPQEPLLETRDLAYEAEYLINSYVVGNIPVWYLNLRLPAIIKKIKLAHISVQQMKEMHNSQIMRGGPSEVSTRQTRDDDHFGYLKDSTRILNDLIGTSSVTSRQTISIYGMPGLGKTTAASELYNSRATLDYFDRRVWCVVSQTYSVRKLLIHILMNVTLGRTKDEILKMKDDEIGVEIHKSLKQRRYLIVLDDVWDTNIWYDLKRYFPDDGNRSRVLLTNRVKAAAPDGSIFHTLPLLSKDQCWDLLEKKVFHKESCPSQLLDIGKRIAAKCAGIPLAVVVTAGILVNLEKEESAWENVERRFGTFLLDVQIHYRKILELSYEHLPYNIKPCFLFFAAFPEDAEISVKKLVWWWIAQGFIQKDEEKIQKDEETSEKDDEKSNTEKSLEEIAETYLLDLINRSLLWTAERGSNGSIKTCKIHDLLHEMCIRKAGEENFLESTKGDFSIYQKHHHLCVSSTSPTYSRPFGPHCRSIIGRLSNESLCFQTMPVLKVVDMLPNMYDSYVFERFDLPFHLRYLGVDQMPKVTSADLVNLEFLCIMSRDRVRVPSVILRMVKLRHLLIKHVAEFEEDCNGSETTNLTSLSYVCIYKKKDEEILRHSPHLHELKCKCGGEITFPDLSFLTKLESLKIIFEINLSDKTPPNFNFPSTIKKLCLSGAQQLSWEKMSVIGRLPNLYVLKLEYISFVGDEWETKDGEFEKLRFLKIESVELRQWSSCYEHFPVLERLVLSSCSELLEIPIDFGEIETLQSIQVLYSSKEASLSAVVIEEEQHKNGNDELKVIITSYEWTKEELAMECRNPNEAE